MKKKYKDHIEDESEDEIVSRAAIKRELQVLADLAKELVELNDAQLAKLPLNDVIVAAVVESRRIHQHIARKRHLKYIAKQMREIDEQALIAAMSVSKDQDRAANARFHHMEKWRDRLIEEGDEGLKDFMDEYPQVDRQKIRQLVRNAQKEQQTEQPPKSSRALFKLIRSVMDA